MRFREISTTLQRTNTENLKHIFPEKELRGHSPNLHIHMSVSDLYITTCSARDWDGKDYLRIIPRVVLVEDPRLT